jgi:hypothetical protein
MMIGRHFQLSVNYHGWIIEFDRFGDTVLEDAKIRRSLHDRTLGLALFPAGPEGFLGGFYTSVGAGIGWAGTAIIPVHEGGTSRSTARGMTTGVPDISPKWVTDSGSLAIPQWG